jgi:predicted enzyme related to lactoylglutathione lyase
MIREIAFTGTPVTDMERARAFYEQTLGLRPSEDMAGGKWVEYSVGGGTFAITTINAGKWTPSDQGTAIAFEVDDFEKANARLKQRGTRYWLEPSESPVCWMAIIQDPDGNKIVIHKRKPTQERLVASSGAMSAR